LESEVGCPNAENRRELAEAEGLTDDE